MSQNVRRREAIERIRQFDECLSAMVGYEFRVKFAPGETKKGKVWLILQNYFCGMKGTAPEQTALMWLILETDVINQLPFSLKLALGTAQKKVQQGRGGKKGKKKWARRESGE
jgi:hypothetical protein